MSYTVAAGKTNKQMPIIAEGIGRELADFIADSIAATVTKHHILVMED